MFLTLENIGTDNKIINFELIVTDLWPFEGFGTILDAILKKNFSEAPILVNLLVCCKVHKNITESVEKPFVAIFWGLNCILTGLLAKLASKLDVVSNCFCRNSK